MKKYRYSDFKKDGWSSEYGERYRTIFCFKEIEKPRSEIKVTIEITGPRKLGWENEQSKSGRAVTDNDLIKVLSGIAKEEGLKKGFNFIEIKGDAYPDISKFEEYGMEEGCEFTIQFLTSNEEVD